MIRYVAQEDADGCSVATVAMILDVSYDEAKLLLTIPFSKKRLCEIEIDAALFDAGFATQRRYHFDPVKQEKRAVWPPAPFAPMHWALVVATQGAHAVAMDSEGLVYDPFRRERSTLQHPDYREIHHVTGVWRVK